jgi:FkbM family methyltransferase
MTVRRVIRNLLRKLGYRISRAPDGVGGDPFADMSLFITGSDPLIFDVGANVGQSIARFRSWFGSAEIHSFEPSPTTFAVLERNASRLAGVHLHNLALGSSSGELLLGENRLSEWSSVLPLGETGWGSVVRQTKVPVQTVDQFCLDHGIGRVDILKSDTQGYDFEVLKGASQMFGNNAVSLVYAEIIFSNLYQGMAPFTELYDFLISRDFLLISLYDFAYTKDHCADWTDALFAHRSLVAKVR